MRDVSPAGEQGSGSASDLLLARLVEEYGEQLRAGEAPDVEQFARRLPAREAELREYLATIDTLERAEPESGGRSVSGLQVHQLGQYRVERELGRGGMGVVFLATDEKLGRKVALKLLPIQATLDPRFLRRFEREARAAAQLTHPNIVPVYGVGEHEALHYYAMQYVEGHALDRVVRALRERRDEATSTNSAQESSVAAMGTGLLRREISSDSGDTSGRLDQAPVGLRECRGPTYFRNVARIGIQVAEGLAYAHSHGVLHRDIKPSNLLLNADGRVWITDFGLCATAEADQLTVTTDLVGTLRYMAPEQIDGRGDVRSDEYGLGITLYELLTLRPAFPGRDRAGLMRDVGTLQPPRPRKLDPEIPRDLEAIVLKATAKLPEERYGSTAALAQDLQAFLEGRPITARPPGALHLMRLAVRRNKVLAGTIAAALAVLLLVSWFYVDGLRQARDLQDRNLYQASVAAAAASSSNPQTARNYLEQAPAHLRNWEWAQLDASLDSSLSTVSGDGTRLYDLDVSPDGRLLLKGGERLVVRELVEPRRVWVLGGPWSESVEISPDGQRAVTVGRTALQALSLEGEPSVTSTHAAPSADPTSVCYDRSGERVFVGTRSGRIHAYDSELERELFTLPAGHGGWVTELQVTADGRTLLSSSWDGTIQAHDLESLDARVVGRHGSPIFSIDVTDDGQRLAAGGQDGAVRLWNVSTGRVIAAWDGHEGIVRRVRFSADGKELVSGGDDRTLRVWDTLELECANVLKGHDAGVNGLAYLPDGRIVSGSSGSTIKEWHPHAAGGSVSLRGHVCDLWSVAFDRSGERLVSSSRDGTVRVWDARTGRQLRAFVHSMPASAVFSADGRSVLAGYKDGSIRSFEVESGEPVWEHVPAAGELDEDVRVACDPGGDRLYTVAFRRGLDAWERAASGWTRTSSVELPQASTIELSSSGRFLSVGSWDGTCSVFDTSTLDLLWQTPELEQGWLSTSFSRDEKTLVAGGWSGRITLWNVPDGKRLREIQVEPEGDRQTSNVWGVDFNPDGSRLACATENLGVTLWDPARGELVARLRGREKGHMRAVFSPDGRRIATPSWRGLIRIWDTTSAGDRLQEIRSSSPDALALEHARRGTVAGLHAVVLSHLRSSERTPEDLRQALNLAYGLMKEHSFDPRALGAYGEALYRHQSLSPARQQLLAAVDASELAGAPSFDAYVFLAMVEARLRHPEGAYAAFDRAHQLADVGDEEDAWLLAEAEELVRAIEE